MRCPRCNELFAIAWDDAPVESSREALKPDHRVTRRRISRDRRTGDDRRDSERRMIGWAPLPAERRLADRRVQAYRRCGRDRRGTADRRRATS